MQGSAEPAAETTRKLKEKTQGNS